MSRKEKEINYFLFLSRLITIFTAVSVQNPSLPITQSEECHIYQTERYHSCTEGKDDLKLSIDISFVC
jgi:hypothetical protein